MNDRLKHAWDRDKELIDLIALYVDHVLTLAESAFDIETHKLFVEDNDITEVIKGDTIYQFELTIPLGLIVDICREGHVWFHLNNKFGNIQIEYNPDTSDNKTWGGMKKFAHDVKEYSAIWKQIFDNGIEKFDNTTLSMIYNDD